jgi:hypothetical protein
MNSFSPVPWNTLSWKTVKIIFSPWLIIIDQRPSTHSHPSWTQQQAQPQHTLSLGMCCCYVQWFFFASKNSNKINLSRWRARDATIKLSEYWAHIMNDISRFSQGADMSVTYHETFKWRRHVSSTLGEWLGIPEDRMAWIIHQKTLHLFM